MSSEENKCEQQSTLFSCSLCSHSCIRMPVSEKPGNIKLSSSEPGCSITAITNSPKLCQTCTINFTTPKPVTFYAEPCACEDETLPSPTASVEDINVDKCEPCDTPGCIHNSQGVEPSYEDSDPCPVSCTGACSSHSPVSSQKAPIYIDPLLKNHTPKSIEELKASISGLISSKQSCVGNLLEYENIEFCYEIRSSRSDCGPKDSQPSKPVCSDKVPVRQGFSLTKEPNDHRFCTNPNTCKHSRESCEPPPCPPEEPPCSSKKPPCSSKKPPCPPVEPSCPSKEPPCPSKEPPCPSKEPPCPPVEPPCPPEEPPCPPEEPPCLPEKPPCPPEEPPCPLKNPPCPPKESLCPPEEPPSPTRSVQFASQ